MLFLYLLIHFRVARAVLRHLYALWIDSKTPTSSLYRSRSHCACDILKSVPIKIYWDLLQIII